MILKLMISAILFSPLPCPPISTLSLPPLLFSTSGHPRIPSPHPSYFPPFLVTSEKKKNHQITPTRLHRSFMWPYHKGTRAQGKEGVWYLYLEI
ncbi:unnamed protein product [Coffea canephora]|uniref:DH200=94 genomic scaffold, scaffold_309 n=1 Tax=Coffea canephora TaxID=49390 RepID=A0A068VDM8_COFCA|nr:unnamed protein product [Coffea canephora]